jgi:hypothetical protein
MTGTGWVGRVEPGTPVGFVETAIEIFLDNPFPPLKFVAPAHSEIVAETFRTESAWTRIGASPE